jgi:hypothetical protein
MHEARAEAELEALAKMRGPREWLAAVENAGFARADLTEIPARRSWYPPGLVIHALSDHL